ASQRAFTGRVRSPLDSDAMRRAALALVRRHGALRTVYRTSGGTIMQHLLPEGDVDFARRDATNFSAAQLRQAVEQAYRDPFDLGEGPLLRLRMFTCAPDDHIVLLVAHHIACDGWSLWILLDELKTLYQAAAAGVSAQLHPLPWSFTDAVRWQEEMVAGEAGQRLWHFWREELSGELPVLDLPT